MSHRVAGAPLDFTQLRVELGVPGDFASEVEAEASAAARATRPPEHDATDIPFVTVDPAGSRDLDQAVHLSRSGDGVLVRYAIADVAAFVRPGGAIDTEARRRGETLYFPDRRVPLHPATLSEGAASLLPGVERPAALWEMRLDSAGEVVDATVRRARVRSIAALDYPGVQRAIDAGAPPEPIVLLQEVGEARIAQRRRLHSIDLGLPEQIVQADGSGAWSVELRADLPVELWNAEISLLTGMCAARLMLDAGIGILRTVPPPDARTVSALRRAALAVGIDWPEGTPPGDVLAGIDRARPADVAFLEHAAMLLRGAGYAIFDGTPPAQQVHAGIGGPYAHVTAPLRRLVDRFGTEICLAGSASAVPDWVRAALPELPAQMAQADQLGHRVDRAVVDMTEAWLLRDRVGETFDAVVLDADEHAGTVVLEDPAVRARCGGDALPVGERIRVRLLTADVATRQVRFERARPASSPPK